MSQSLTNGSHIYFLLHCLMTFFSSSGLYSLQTGQPSGTAASGSSPVISWWASSLRSLQSSSYMKREFLINGHRSMRSSDIRQALSAFVAILLQKSQSGLNVLGREKHMVQVKFLCVHKKLRLKRMTPVLIRELTRRVNQQGLYQAVYAAAVVLPTPLSSCR